MPTPYRRLLVATALSLAFVCSVGTFAPVCSAQQVAPSEAQIELEKKQLEVEKAKLDLERSKTELEAARLALQAKETEEQLTMMLQGDVLFDFGEADLRGEAKESLNKVAVVLAQFPDSSVVIRGYTDSKGSVEANLGLSGRRATAVKTWLVDQAKLNDAKISTQGLGESDPVAENTHADGSDNPEGRRQNRRVEIVVTKLPPARTGQIQ